ncbi:hypothetical protein DFP72DRAFT_904159 [Ephemerocybe angulata]|uniref:F-box domain-containing protein n=1 Tax=Ephemerocybe angulata TaxID=980116 RepID=A0A8H6M2Y9_9AGAR|nr:hypothetical protein DFP72DRAFT_904159 [Tulosesus angulatus]
MTRICADDMPHEIWLRIFQTCVQLYRAPDDNPFAKPRSNAKLPCTPFLLSAVCTDWRKISLSNSTLWSTVFIVLVGTSGGRQDPKLRIEAMELWIQRARSLPLLRLDTRDGKLYRISCT